MTAPVDCHSHTAYSGHGEGSIADAVSRAEQLGLAVYCQTEHLWLPDWIDPDHGDSMTREQTGAYLADLRRERARLAEEGSPMQLVMGVEADWLEGRDAELVELCAPFEYVLGSVHFVDGLAVDCAPDAGAWPELGVDGTWRRYFECWLDMAQSAAPIDCFAHPDLPKKYGLYPSFPTGPWFERMAEAAAARGSMVEVNTAGLRKRCGEMYPSPEALRAFARAGVACTVGCDAHRPEDIGANVEDAYALMREAGYRHVTAPLPDGDRRQVPLD